MTTYLILAEHPLLLMLTVVVTAIVVAAKA